MPYYYIFFSISYVIVYLVPTIYTIYTGGDSMKDATIMLRVTAEQKLAIKRTARKLGLTITEFTLLSLMHIRIIQSTYNRHIKFY